MGTNEGTNFSNRQIPYGFVVVLAQELRASGRMSTIWLPRNRRVLNVLKQAIGERSSI